MKRIVLTCVGLISAFMMAAQTDTLKIFVSVSGNDANPGTINAPVKSFQQAVNLVSVSRTQSPLKPVVVQFRGGDYQINQAITIPVSASGTKSAPVIFRAFANEKPVFVGSVDLKNWKALNDASISKRLTKGVANQVFYIDLKSSGVQDLGQVFSTENRPDLYCNNVLQTVARWPNVGFTHTGKARGATPTDSVWSKDTGTKEGIVEYRDMRINNWSKERDFKLHGYWFWDWTDKYLSASVDTKKHLLTLEKPWEEGGYKDSLRFYGVGLLCELDSVSEWYLDKIKGKLYWFPPKGIDPTKADVKLTNKSFPYMVEAKDCSYLSFEGLFFAGSRGSGFSIVNGNSCVITNCNFRQFGTDAIFIDGGKDDVVSYCLIENLGGMGIRVKGGDRQTLTPANHRVEQNIVRNYCNYIHTYHPAVTFDGCGITITNDHFSYSPSSAISIDGANIIIQYNEIDHTELESDDQGGIDMWFDLALRDVIIRYNYWHDISGGTLCGVSGVRLDDMISGVRVYGNVFARCGSVHFGAVQINGGKDNVVEDNLFVHCPFAVSTSTWKQEKWDTNFKSELQQKRIHQTVELYAPLYVNRWPEIKHISEDINRNIVRNNLLINTPQVFRLTENNEGQYLLLSNNPQMATKVPVTDVRQYCKAEYLNPLGIRAIPFDEMGVSWNK